MILLLIQYFLFRMSKQLNASCDFQDGLLLCELSKSIVEVVLKVKRKWGKHTLIEDQYNRTEKFCLWDRVDWRVKINTRRKRMTQHTQDSNHDDTKGDSIEYTDSGMYISTGKELDYPSLIFTDLEVAANLSNSDPTNSVTEGPQLLDYVGNYCEDCVTKWPRCICEPESDWDNDHTYADKNRQTAHLLYKMKTSNSI